MGGVRWVGCGFVVLGRKFVVKEVQGHISLIKCLNSDLTNVKCLYNITFYFYLLFLHSFCLIEVVLRIWYQ